MGELSMVRMGGGAASGYGSFTGTGAAKALQFDKTPNAIQLMYYDGSYVYSFIAMRGMAWATKVACGTDGYGSTSGAVSGFSWGDKSVTVGSNCSPSGRTVYYTVSF